MLRMPTAVLMMIGQIEVMKITKIAEGLAVAERREREWQPGQRRHGAQDLEDRIEPAHRPDRLADERAEHDTTTAARPKPIATRCSDVSTRQPRPMSCQPITKNGSRSGPWHRPRS
jgi:hypothetical protein